METTYQNKKPGYDSRQPHAVFLVDLKKAILQSTGRVDDWLRALNIYSSFFEGMVREDEMKSWCDMSQDTEKKITLSRQNKFTKIDETKLLLKLQREIFRITAPLYIPINQDDDNEELGFDLGV